MDRQDELFRSKALRSSSSSYLSRPSIQLSTNKAIPNVKNDSFPSGPFLIPHAHAGGRLLSIKSYYACAYTCAATSARRPPTPIMYCFSLHNVSN